MKNFFKLIGIIAFMAVIVTMSGCSIITPSTMEKISWEKASTFPKVEVAAKDFTTVGLVFTEPFTLEHSRTGSTGTASGEILTYQALLKEAKKLNADAIVNVVIEKKINIKTSNKNESTTETWYGSALAIKYTTKLVETDKMSTGSSSGDISSSASNSSSESSSSGGKKKFLGIF